MTGSLGKIAGGVGDALSGLTAAAVAGATLVGVGLAMVSLPLALVVTGAQLQTLVAVTIWRRLPASSRSRGRS